MSKTQSAIGRARQKIDADFEKHLDRIRSYLKIPSVSATGEGIEAGAEATAELVEAAGGTAEIVATDGHPAVVGVIEGDGPRLVRYGMYDVQPAEEPNWTSPPFAAEVRDLPGIGSAVVARGSVNSKGALASFLLACRSAQQVGDLPVGLALVIDGEEELGSPHLADVIDAHRSTLSADAAFDLDLTADLDGVPEVYLGCKGIISVHLSCLGGDWGGPTERALHSSQGVVVASPAWSLVRALVELVGPEDEVLIPGLATAPTPPEDATLVESLAHEFEPRRHMKGVGIRRHKRQLTADELVRALLYDPAVNVNGVFAGTLHQDKTIIPNEASAVLDIRIPYGADIESIQNSVRDLIAHVAPEVRVEFPEACPPARTSSKSDVARAMIESHGEVGSPARVWPSAPWWAPYFVFESMLRLPFAVGGAGHGGRAHAPDEYATIEGLQAHMHQSIAFLYRFAQMKNGSPVQ